ncbi:ABC transporter substrate-binding protein [Magnetovibrio sp. PR-2]|uniref:MlaC/ttg2D family ABC transporter substrate-binding protein n=1 Tax=Magnetovibrio sp. PR-2 TaxID=3120356 RepID=UPI002FCE32C4
MMYRRLVLTILLVCGLALFTAPVSANTTQSADTAAQDFIQGLADQAVQALTAKDVTREQRIERFHELFGSNFDVPFIGKWVLGRYWKKASDTEKQEYLKLFEEYVVVSYVERFDQYSGEQIHVVKTVSDPGKDSIVFSEINRPSGGDPIRVNWRVRNKSDIYKIIDVHVEGISMSQSQRKEFTSVIRSNGGKVSGLNAVLRKKLDSLTK